MMWLGIVQKGKIFGEQKRRIRRWDMVFLLEEIAGGTCNRKSHILFWYNTYLSVVMGFFFNKTWNYVVIWIHVFSDTNKHG
jgi:hypothetical protein